MNTNVNHYMKQVKRCFPIHGRKEKRYVEELKKHVLEYEDEYPSLSYKDLEEEFGKPSSIVSEYFSHVDNAIIVAQLRNRMRIKKAMWMFLVVALVTWMILCVWQYKEYQESLKHNVAYTEIYIEDLGDQ